MRFWPPYRRWTGSSRRHVRATAGRRAVTRLVLGALAALSVSSAAAAYWSTTGTGSAAGQTTTALALTISAGVPNGQLHPGGTADVAVSITNPNGFAARVGALSLDSAQGTGGFGVDAGHAACAVSALAFATQSHNGSGWSVPPKVGGVDGTLAIDLSGAISMDTTAVDACQGATVTVYLRAGADYQTAVLNTAGLVSYWRLGTDPPVNDTMTDSAGTMLQSHTGETGATWTSLPGSGSANAVITDAGRVRRNGGYSIYTASGAASGADYAVQADVYVRSTLGGDMTGVIGRADVNSALGTFYYAGYRQSDTAWHLVKYVNGVPTNLATSASSPLTAGQAYRVRLTMVGSMISLQVNDVQQTSANDSGITIAGRGGILDGDMVGGTTVALTDTTGLHLDNVSVVDASGTTATDSMGVNPGTFAGGPLLNVPGGLVGNANTATRFDGSGSYATALRQIADNFSIELWFNSTQGLNLGAQWWNAAGMVDSDASSGSASDFGVALRSDGKVVAGVGGVSDVSVLSAAGYNNGSWHHVVMTRVKASGVVALYIDGASVGSSAGSTASLTAQPAIAFGRLASGGNFFAGALDDVAVYNTALSADAVADHYRIGHGS